MKGIIALGALTATVGAASAQLMVFTDRVAWEAAIGGAAVFTEDFNAQTPGIIADGATLDTGLLQITRNGSPNGADGLLEIEPGANFGNLDGTTFLSGETGIEPHERVEFGFNGNSVFAFGGDWFSPFSGDGIALDIDGEIVLLDAVSGFDQGFIGVVGNSAFGSVAIVGTPDAISFQELWSVDNISYAIPSPATAALLGLSGLIAARRQRA
jgi:hypothetical protein